MVSDEETKLSAPSTPVTLVTVEVAVESGIELCRVTVGLTYYNKMCIIYFDESSDPLPSNRTPLRCPFSFPVFLEYLIWSPKLQTLVEPS